MLEVVLVALGLCLLEMGVIVMASPLAKPALVLRFLPEDVRLAAQGHPEPPLWKQLIAHAHLAGLLVAMLAGVFYVGREGLRDGCGFWGLTAALYRAALRHEGLPCSLGREDGLASRTAVKHDAIARKTSWLCCYGLACATIATPYSR